MTDTQHFSFEQLADYAGGRITVEARGAVESHLASGCPVCAVEVALLRRMTRAMQAEAWTAPPARAHFRAAQSFRTFAARRRRGRVPSVAWRPAAVVFVAVALVIVILALRAPQTVHAASLAEVVGLVEVRDRPDGPWHVARMGQALVPGSEVRTGEGGSARIVYPGGSWTHLAGQTAVRLAVLSQSRGSWDIVVAQTKGRTETRVELSAANYRLLTSVGEVDASDTFFHLEVMDNGSVEIKVNEGRVTVSSTRQMINVGAGQSAQLPPPGPNNLVIMNQNSPTAVPTVEPPTQAPPPPTATAAPPEDTPAPVEDISTEVPQATEVTPEDTIEPTVTETAIDVTPTEEATLDPTVTETAIDVTPTEEATLDPNATETPEATGDTDTPTATATVTGTDEPTGTASPTASPTPSPTVTSVPILSTPSPTATGGFSWLRWWWRIGQ